MMNSLFDWEFPRSEMYRAWVIPELFPYERQPVLSNWSAEDLWAYCGVIKEHID